MPEEYKAFLTACIMALMFLGGFFIGWCAGRERAGSGGRGDG